MFLTIFNRVGIFFPAEPPGCQWCCIPDMEVRRQIPDNSALALQHKHLIDVSPYFGIKMVLKIWLWYENYPIWCLMLKEHNQACQFTLQWKNRDYLRFKTMEIKLWFLCWCFHDFWPEQWVTPCKKCQDNTTVLIKCWCFTLREFLCYYLIFKNPDRGNCARKVMILIM